MEQKWEEIRGRMKFNNRGFRESKREVEREFIKVEYEYRGKWTVTTVKTLDSSP